MDTEQANMVKPTGVRGAEDGNPVEKAIRAGDLVCIVAIPNWLVHDLPADDAAAILRMIGKERLVTGVDSSGCIWFSGAEAVQMEDGSWRGDPTFCITADCVKSIK